MSSNPTSADRPKDATELLDLASVADEEKRALKLQELVGLDEQFHPSTVFPLMVEAWTKIVETWNAEKAKADAEKNSNEPTADAAASGASPASLKPEDNIDEPSFRRAAFAVASRELIPALIFRFLQDGATISLSFLVRGLVNWINLSDTDVADRRWEGFVWATAIFVAQVISLGCQALSMKTTLSGLLKIQSTVVTAVFDKTLRLRSDVLANYKGQIVGLHSSESHALRMNPFLPSIITAIPMLLGIVISLYFLVDLPGLTAVGVTIVFAIIQNVISSRMSATRIFFLAKTDNRLKKVAELIQGIKLVKLMAWEPFFEAKITEYRAEEIEGLSSMYVYRSAIIAMSHLLAPILSLAVFGVYSAVYGNQNPAAVFPTLVLLNVLRTTMTGFAMALSKFIDLLTSLDRYGRFLRLEERISYVETNNNNNNSTNNHEHDVSENDFVLEMDKPVSVGYHTKNNPNNNTKKPSSIGNQKQKLTTATKFLSRVKKVSSFPNNNNNNDKHNNANNFNTQHHDELYFVPLLCDVRLNIKKGDLVAIVGPTAAGKTQLINLLLGDADIDPENFSPSAVKHNYSVGVSAQDPWIMNRTIRDNILADQEFDLLRYASVLVSACLLEDLAAFPLGDLSDVGERGLVVSGGQKSRISLARLLYADKEINFLDDVLSALDAHIGEAIVQNCILGQLKNKTRILVTQHFQILPKCDRIIALKQQEIVFDGTNYEEFAKWAAETEYSAGQDVMNQNNNNNIKNKNEVVDSDASEEELMKREASHHVSESMITAVAKNIHLAIANKAPYYGEFHVVEETANNGNNTSEVVSEEAAAIQEEENQKNEKKKKDSKLIVAEEIHTGSVSWNIYFYYCSCAGLFLTFLIHISFAFWRTAHLMCDFWLSIWTSRSGGFGQVSFTNEQYLTWFGVCSALTIIAVLCRQVTYTAGLNNVAGVIHAKLLHRVIRAPMRFFETNTAGRLVNRFGADMSAVDLTVAEELMFTTSLFYLILSQVVAMIMGAVYMIPVILIIGIIFHLTRVKYAITLRNVRRLENASRSPVLSIMNETLVGMSTIRVFEQIPHVTKRHMAALVDLLHCAYSFVLVQTWIAYRVTWLGSVVVGFMAFLVTILRVFQNSSGGGGLTLGNGVMSLALSYSIALATSLAYFIATVSQTDATMSSVERIKEYSEDIELEKDVEYFNAEESSPNLEEQMTILNNNNIVEVPVDAHDDKNVKPKVASLPFGWPLSATDGSIEFRNVSMRYRANLPLVLKNVSFTIKRGERVAVVGKSGQGKSTILSALFRLVEIENDGIGKILVDGRDTRTVKLCDLRKHLGIISQDPILYSGTVRSNLDPFDLCTDEELWDALELIGLKDRVGGSRSKKESDHDEKILAASNDVDKGLNAVVNAGGTNWSTGERQLLCLARALLRNTSTLALDEASSATDSATDALMQKILRDRFKHATLLTIAHRLTTIADYDKVLVVKEGTIGEFDHPHILLQKNIDDATGALFAKMVRVLGPAQEANIKKIAQERYNETH